MANFDDCAAGGQTTEGEPSTNSRSSGTCPTTSTGETTEGALSATFIGPSWASCEVDPAGPGLLDGPPVPPDGPHDDDTYATAAPRPGDGRAFALGLPFVPLVPGYEIRGLLGQGGMGVVYKAHQVRADRPVALKMIRGDARVGPEQLERFRVEAQSVASLRHPNVVQVYDVGDVAGLPYFSLELLEGGNLKDRLAAAPMPPRDAASLLARLAGGVEAAHRAGIIHRDLKPANILFDLDGTPKVADFGLAKRLEEDGQTITGQVMGTPSYMAPEQALGRNREVGPPADLYSLGAVLYEALTGRPPFKGATASETLLMVTYQDPLPPSRIRPRLPRDLETICLKCLAKEPARRYESAAALAEDLGRFLDGDPIRARRTPAWERAARWARRRPAAAALVLLVVAAIAGLAAAAVGRERALTRRWLAAVDDLNAGSAQRARGDLVQARVTLSTLAAGIGTEPRLAPLRLRAEEELARVAAESARQADRAALLGRFERFGRLRDEALFAIIHFDDLGGDGDTASARRAAREALAVFGPGDAGLDALDPGPKAEVLAGRELVVMALSSAIARPLPGEDPAGQARQALAALDDASPPIGRGPAYHLRRAACLAGMGDYPSAALEREQAARLAPSGATDHLLLGQERGFRGDWGAARAHLEAAVREQPSLFWAHCLLAVAELSASPPRAAEARAELTTCLLQRPSYPGLYLLRGLAYGQQGMALAAAAKAPSGGAELAAEAAARAADAEADFDRALRLGLNPKQTYALLANRGLMRLQAGHPDAAVADFRRAIALDGTRYDAHASLAQALRKLGRRDEAIEEFGRAIAARPGMAALYRGRALARLDPEETPDGVDGSPGEAEAALADLEASARLEPPGSRAPAGDHAARGRILFRLGDHARALEAADAALRVDGDGAPAHRVRVSALLALRRFAEALDASEEALARSPSSAELHHLRGLARAGRGDFPGAVDSYTEALGLGPHDPAGLRRDRGWSLLFANSVEMALRDFEAAVELEPGRADGYAGRAAARVRLGRVAEAVVDAEEALRRASTARTLYIAAQTYAQAAVRAAAEVPRRGRSALRDAMAYQARAGDLIRRAIEQTPAADRAGFRADVVDRDPTLRALLRNPKAPPAPGPETSASR